MKKTLTTALVAATGAVLFSQAANAQSYTGGDLLLGLNTPTASTDLLVDIGSITTYQNAFASGAALPISIPGLSLADVNTAFGNFNNVQWAVMATHHLGDPTLNFATGTPPLNTLWLSDPTTTPGASTPWTRAGNTAQQSVGGKIGSIGGGYTTSTKSVNSSTEAIQTATAGTSYNFFQGPNGDLGGTFAGGNFEQITPANFTAGGQFSYADLYELTPGSGNGTLLGTFQLGSDASLIFVPVPEPTTYGLIAGAGLLALSLRNQFRRKQA